MDRKVGEESAAAPGDRCDYVPLEIEVGFNHRCALCAVAIT